MLSRHLGCNTILLSTKKIRLRLLRLVPHYSNRGNRATQLSCAVTVSQVPEIHVRGGVLESKSHPQDNQ